jgi:hypothetical protein
VETGVSLTSHQLGSLNNNLLDTYFRRRLMAHARLLAHELKYLPDSRKGTYIERILDEYDDLNSGELELLTPEQVDAYFKRRLTEIIQPMDKKYWVRGANFFNDSECRYLKNNKELFYQYMKVVCDICINQKSNGTLMHAEIMPDALIEKFFRAKIKQLDSGECYRLSEATFKKIPKALIRPYFEIRLKGFKDKIKTLKSRHPRDMFEKYMKVLLFKFEPYESEFVPEDIELELQQLISIA